MGVKNKIDTLKIKTFPHNLINRMLLIAFSLLLIASLEFISYLIIPDTKLSELELILKVLEKDPVLFWRQRPDLDVLFQGVKVRTGDRDFRGPKFDLKKSGNTFRIVCLGPSSTFGWGIENTGTYVYLLGELIGSAGVSSRKVEVINAGVIGYSSCQGKLLLKNDILRLDPDIIIVAYLINDIDKHRFYRSNGKADNELGEENKILVWVENVLERSNLCRLLKRILLSGKGKSLGYGGGGEGNYFENRRVSRDDYAANLNQIINMAEARGIKVVFINTPIGISYSARKYVDKEGEGRADKCIDLALTYGSLKGYDPTIKELRKALEYNPYSARAFYYLGVYHFKKNDADSAKIYFQKAKEMELLECVRLTRVYNDIMSRVASERNIPMVDAVSAFDEFTRKTGLSLFINPPHDFVHPNIEGHRIISQEIYRALFESNLLPSCRRDILTGGK